MEETTMADVQIRSQENESQPVQTERMKARVTFMPRTDIAETPEALVLVADLPGVQNDKIEIHVENDVLTITGHVEPEVFEGFQAALIEYEVGDYERSFVLSEAVDSARIEAVMKDGVLTVTLPKAERVKTRKIPVKAG